MCELPSRQVDAHHEIGAVVEPLLPLAYLATRGLEHPLSKGHDEARLFRERDELDRPNQATAGVPPADERFELRQSVVVVEADQRLIVHFELVAMVERFA